MYLKGFEPECPSGNANSKNAAYVPLAWTDGCAARVVSFRFNRSHMLRKASQLADWTSPKAVGRFAPISQDSTRFPVHDIQQAHLLVALSGLAFIALASLQP